MDNLKNALERGNRLEAEIEAADPAMKAQLLGSYKELLIENFVSVVKRTNRPDLLALLDRDIEFVEELTQP